MEDRKSWPPEWTEKLKNIKECEPMEEIKGYPPPPTRESVMQRILNEIEVFLNNGKTASTKNLADAYASLRGNNPQITTEWPVVNNVFDKGLKLEKDYIHVFVPPE